MSARERACIALCFDIIYRNIFFVRSNTYVFVLYYLVLLCAGFVYIFVLAFSLLPLMEANRKAGRALFRIKKKNIPIRLVISVIIWLFWIFFVIFFPVLLFVAPFFLTLSLAAVAPIKFPAFPFCVYDFSLFSPPSHRPLIDSISMELFVVYLDGMGGGREKKEKNSSVHLL